MKRILRITHKSGKLAEAEIAIWISTIVSMMPPHERDALFNVLTNNAECLTQSPWPEGRVLRGEVLGCEFTLSEFE